MTKGPWELWESRFSWVIWYWERKLYCKWLESTLQEDKEFMLKELRFDGINLGTDQLCVCAHTHTHIYLIYTDIHFSSYGKGNNGFYLELTIGKQDVTERQTVEEFESAGKSTRKWVQGGLAGGGNHEDLGGAKYRWQHNGNSLEEVLTPGEVIE